VRVTKERLVNEGKLRFSGVATKWKVYYRNVNKLVTRTRNQPEGIKRNSSFILACLNKKKKKKKRNNNRFLEATVGNMQLSSYHDHFFSMDSFQITRY
jgi:hypothetical protein